MIVLPQGEEYDQVVRKSEQYSKRAEAIWETRSESTAPATDVKELPEFERLAQEAQVWVQGGGQDQDLWDKISKIYLT